MVLCSVRCSRCGLVQSAPDPSKIPYRMVLAGGRMVPVCDDCHAADRKPGGK